MTTSSRRQGLGFVRPIDPARISDTHRQRFWKMVDRAGGDPSACWVWKAGRTQGHYGVFCVGGQTHALLAHRVSWVLANGPLGAGMLVLHACDNPPCVNPAHLFAGTQAENLADCLSKGRGRRSPQERERVSSALAALGEWRVGGPGSAHARSDSAGHRRLSGAMVGDILAAYPGCGLNLSEIGKLFGVSPWTIRKVVRRLTWQHLPVPAPDPNALLKWMHLLAGTVDESGGVR